MTSTKENDVATVKSKNNIVLSTILRIIAFLLCLFLSLNMLSLIFTPKSSSSNTAAMKYITESYKGENKNTIDTFFVGNSDLYRAVNPKIIDSRCNLSSCVSGKGNQTPSGARQILSDMYKCQSPDTVVIETDMFCSNLKLSINAQIKEIYKTVKTAVKDFDNSSMSGISYVFPVFKYHNRWNELKKRDVKDIKACYRFKDKGFWAEDTVEPYNGGFSYMDKSSRNIETPSKSAIKELDKMVRMCQLKGSNVILLEVPSAVSWNMERHNFFQSYAKSNNLTFVDCNIEGTVKGFDWTKDSKDGGDHLNTYGAQKVSNYLCTVLSKHQADKAV